MKYTKLLSDRNLIHPPKWLVDNTFFEGMTGSVSYAASDDTADLDIVGFCIPPKETLFPHLRGEIMGFGTPGERFDQFQKHHIELKDHGKEIDMTIYSIVKFFQLAMENNPNIISALFLPRRCVLHSTQIYEHIRDNKTIFLHKGAFHKFRGYAFSQVSKLKNGSNRSNEKRKETIDKAGYDTKFSYHIIRLALECEQILEKHDLDIECNGSLLRSIRNGDWALEDIFNWFTDKEKHLEELYHTSTLPYKPDENKIKQLLLQVLEMHYGSISNEVVIDVNKNIINDIQSIIEKYR